MALTLIQMTIIMACGVGWRFICPQGITVAQTRQILTTLVYFIFLPALVLNVLRSVEMNLHSIEIAFLGVSGILSTLLITWLTVRLLKFDRPQVGVVLLAAAFPNVIYLGLPVLEQTFGLWASSVAVQINFYAVSPLVYTVGLLIARYYGEASGKYEPLLFFLKTPPFCAVYIAILLNLTQASLPLWFSGVLNQLSAAVVPLMLFSLGLSLSWKTFKFKNLPYIVPIVVLKLVFMPLLAIATASFFTMSGEFKTAAIIEMAMPSMMVGIIFCDQYKLDSELYAMAVTVTTLLSILTLPFWYGLV